MGMLDPTIDALVSAATQREFPGFDSTRIEDVTKFPRLEAGQRYLKIGTVREVVVFAIKKGALVIGLWYATVSAWDAFVAGATLFAPNDIPAARELAEIVRTGATKLIDDYPNSVFGQGEQTYFVVREQLPADLEIVSGNSESIPSQTIPVGPIATTTTTTPNPHFGGPYAAAGPLPTTGNISGSTSLTFSIVPPQLDARDVIPAHERIALVSSTGVSRATIQNAVPLRFGVQDQAIVRSFEDIQVRRIDI